MVRIGEQVSSNMIMTFLAFGNKVILSSSQNGPSFTYEYANSPVKESLSLCMAVWKEQTGEKKRHGRRASCGEMMCAHQYYQLHNTPLKDAKVRCAHGDLLKEGETRQIHG
jgi:hypothetical protein